MKLVKISDDVYDKLRELAEKKQVSVNNVIAELLNVYIGGSAEDKPIKRIIDKDIVLQYPTKCRRCGRELNVGDVAHYVRYEYDDGSTRYYIYCMDCWLQSSALAQYYIKKKQLEATVKGLKDMANKLADKIVRMKTEYNIAVVKEELMNIRRELNLTFVRNAIGEQKADELAGKIDKVLDKITEIDAKLKEIEVAMKLRLKPEAKAEARAEERW